MKISKSSGAHLNSHTHDSLVLNKSLLILLQASVTTHPIFCVHSTSLVPPITMFTNLVIQAVNLWNVTLSRHFHLLRLQLQYQSLISQKRSLKKRKGKNTMTYGNAKIPEISVDSSYQNIWDHLWKWSSYFGQPKFSDSSILTNRFIIVVLLLTYVANSEKEYMKLYKLVRARLLLFHRMWSIPHVINTILGHHAHYFDFLAGIFRGSQKRGSRLAAWGSGSQDRKIASPLIASGLHCCHVYTLCPSTFRWKTKYTSLPPLRWDRGSCSGHVRYPYYLYTVL